MSRRPPNETYHMVSCESMDINKMAGKNFEKLSLAMEFPDTRTTNQPRPFLTNIDLYVKIINSINTAGNPADE